jgi:hypothetical protein
MLGWIGLQTGLTWAAKWCIIAEEGLEMPDFAYDVFLSHNKAQKDWTRDLARRLRDERFQVWFDEWCLRGGES